MRIAIIASGSRGDVEPYVALGKGLQAAGHVVRLVTHRELRIAGHVARGGFLARRRQRAGRRGKHGGADRERELPRHPGADGQGGPTRRAGVDQREPGGLPGHGTGGGGHRWGVRGRCHRGEAGDAAVAGVLHPLHAYARLSGLRRAQTAVVPRHAAQPPVVSGGPADDVAGVPVGRQTSAAGGVGPSRGPVLRPLQIRMRAGPADPVRLQPGRHPAARGLGRRHPCDRLLVPRSGRGLDAGPGPGGFPGGRPAAGLRRLREHEQPETGGNCQSDPGRAGARRDSAASSTPAGAGYSGPICRTPC